MPRFLDADMRRLYGTGDFESVGYRFLEEPGKRVLAVDAVEKGWGPDYLRMGLGLSSDSSGDAFSTRSRVIARPGSIRSVRNGAPTLRWVAPPTCRPSSISRSTPGGTYFVAVDTPIGPMYLAYGRAAAGLGSFYFFLGRPF
jgi:hypothetical protein